MERKELVNMDTGEVVQAIILEEGDRVLSKNQLDGYAKYLNKTASSNFVFAIFERCELYMNRSELRPQDVTRLIMLATYVDYTGRIMLTQRTPMKKPEIRKIIRESSPNRFNDLLKKFIELGIIKEDNKIYYMSDEYFIKGELGNRSGSRLFINEIRELFNSVKVTDFKRLGYIFKLLPFISYEYNIVCHNPKETILECILPMDANDISEILKIDRTTIKKALSDISKVKVNGEFILGWFSTGGDEVIKLIINPKILYSGKGSASEVNYINKLFE